jgi:hypothetical protein
LVPKLPTTAWRFPPKAVDEDTMKDDPNSAVTGYLPAEEVPLEAFRSALLSAVWRLPTEARSLLGLEVTRQADMLRGLQSAERQHLRKHLDAFAEGMKVPPAS